VRLSCGSDQATVTTIHDGAPESGSAARQPLNLRGGIKRRSGVVLSAGAIFDCTTMETFRLLRST
jgi:hypothetical protein